MSYDIYAGDTTFHLTWNYNARIIQPALGGEGLRQFDGMSCREAAEGIASIIEFLNRKLRGMHSRSTLKQGIGGNGLPEFMETFGDGAYGHVLEAVLRLSEIMIACYRQPDATFTIH